MKLYDWMVDYTPQTTWVEGHGIYIWLAEVFGMLGGGLYLVSLYFNSIEGMLISWLMIVVLKGGFHLAHLGQPARCWRLFLKPESSWLARGFFFVALFMLFGALQLISSHWFPGTGGEFILKVLVGILALLVAAYSGFVMNYVSGIPFWNSALLPLLFVAFGILGGFAVMLLIGPASNRGATFALAQFLLFASTCLLALYLYSATHMGPAAKRSVRELVQGRLALPFWLWVVVCGLVFPMLAILYMYFTLQTPTLLIAITTLGVLVGIFGFAYCLLKAGMYRPLTPTLP